MIREYRRATHLLLAPAVCLILFWRAPFIWFRNDDFVWLGLRLDPHHFSRLLDVLFRPRAQGTMRVLSERLFFLVFGSVFGMHALPFHIWILATWFATLTLAALIGTRLTGSRAAGVVAAVLWTANAVIVLPMVWISAYNQVLCALCILLAFYARLRWLESGGRGWLITEWAAYLAGFGALEIIAMYPFIALLHALPRAPRRWLSTLPLFIPAAIFSAIHFFLIPKTQDPAYAVAMDHRLPATFLTYLRWALAPVLIGDTADGWRSLGLISAPLIAIALLAFSAWRARQRDFTPLFCIGWFVLLIAPVLPLSEHITDYYATIPVLGLAWLAGWAIVSAWRRVGRVGTRARTVAVALVATFLAGSMHEIAVYTRWDDQRSDRLRRVVQAVEQTESAHPGSAILLSGIDSELSESGFLDDPFRLYGIRDVYLVPGGESGVSSLADAADLSHFLITPQRALDLLDHGAARVLAISGSRVTDSTRTYTTVLRARIQPRGNFVDVGDPNYAAQLGPTWYAPDGGARWMPESATVKLSGIDPLARKLYVTGFAPRAAVTPGPIKLTFSGEGQNIGSGVVEKPYQFSFVFPLPPALTGRSSVEISIHASRTLQFPGDGRDMSLVFGTFSIR